MREKLVLLSGLLSNQTLWRHQINHLSDLATIQVISPSQSSAEKMVENILDQAPPKFFLAGHSMGGWLCLEIMRTAPSRVQRLCLINTTARMDSEEKRNKRQTLIKQAEEGGFTEIVKEIADKFVYNSEMKNQVETMFLEVGKEAFIHQEQAMLARDESQSILIKITCPTLVVHAAQDKVFTLEEHQELTAQIQNAELAVVENSGHMSPLEMPENITALLRTWLSPPAS